MPEPAHQRRPDLRGRRIGEETATRGDNGSATCLYGYTGYPQLHVVSRPEPLRMRSLLTRLQSDEALMLAYQAGDVAAFETLYRRHNDGLYAFIYRSCPRPEIVEELAQDSWVAVIDRAAQYRPRARFKTWLYQIAHNRQVDYWRRRDNHHRGLDGLPATTAAPTEEGERVMAAIGRLPGEQKDALLLQEQGFSITDIAAITGAGKETVKSRLRYARNQLRDRLENET